MPTFVFNKLVRDKLPLMYKDMNQKIISRILKGKALRVALKEKLIEEASEVPSLQTPHADVVAELADVEQLLDDLKNEYAVTNEEVSLVKNQKLAKKGGFGGGVFVESIELSDNDEWVEYYRKDPIKYPEVGVMKNMSEEPCLEKGSYRHYKGGIYDVIKLACHTETLEWYVVYQSHERQKSGLPSVWVRPYDMFVENVEIYGEIKPRFEKID